MGNYRVITLLIYSSYNPIFNWIPGPTSYSITSSSLRGVKKEDFFAASSFTFCERQAAHQLHSAISSKFVSGGKKPHWKFAWRKKEMDDGWTRLRSRKTGHVYPDAQIVPTLGEKWPHSRGNA